MTLHNLEELDDDLGRRSDQDLALASLLGVVDGVERIVEDGSADHFGGVLDEILKSGREMRYLPRSMLAFQRLLSEESALNDRSRGFCRPLLKRRSVSRE